MRKFYTFLLVITMLSCQKDASIPHNPEVDLIKDYLAALPQEEKLADISKSLDYASLKVVNGHYLVDALLPIERFGKGKVQKFVFQIENGTIVRSEICSYSESHKRDQELEKALVWQSSNYTGAVTKYSLRGKYQVNYNFKNGKIGSSVLMQAGKGQIQTKQNVGQQKLATTSGQSCIDWYLVTTYYDENGFVIDRTEEYLGTTCTSCTPDDPSMTTTCSQLDDGTGGGGSGGEQEITYDQVFYEDEVAYSEEDEESAGQSSGPTGIPGSYVPIRYAYRASITYGEVSGAIVSVVPHPITATPMSSTYTDTYGRNVPEH